MLVLVSYLTVSNRTHSLAQQALGIESTSHQIHNSTLSILTFEGCIVIVIHYH